MTFKSRILLSMLSVVAISGGVATLVGVNLLWRHLASEAENRVRQDLNTAREFYNHRLELMEASLRYTALGERFSEAVVERDFTYLVPRLAAVRANAALDVLYVADPQGRVIYRPHNPDRAGDSVADDPFFRLAVSTRRVLSGTLLVPLATLQEENLALADRARIPILPTPNAKPSTASELDAGMMLVSAAPVYTPDGALAGVLRAGTLLNRNYDLVDQVRNTVFHDERYQGRPLGTATIFQGDVRISTNVLRQDGQRAVGTRVSAEVYDHVLDQGNIWVGRAWVVNATYFSAYEPIYDFDNRRIGILYVGVLARKFDDLSWRTFTIFALVTLAGLLAAGWIAWKLADTVSRPVRGLARASTAVAAGDFSLTLPVSSSDEIGLLTQAFNTMARSLKERDELLKEETRRQLTRSERLASVGRLAAGVAHEINNPLTGVLTFAHLALKNAPPDSQMRDDLQTIIDATTRCKDIIRGLLDFSRQNEPRKRLTDLNSILREALNLTRNQAAINQVGIVEEFAPDLPQIIIDPNQIQQVAVNVIVNAVDAMAPPSRGGTLAVRTRSLAADDGPWVEFTISDTGCGIPRDNLERIFDPFFTTKQTGKGTGLGLAVSYGIVAEHGGRIYVRSEPSRGTTLTVRLPVSPSESSDEPQTAPPSGA
ncbi:MAG: cache domain-containing protein [Planctomycetota bacterium]